MRSSLATETDASWPVCWLRIPPSPRTLSTPATLCCTFSIAACAALVYRHSQRIRLHPADALDWNPSGSYDLVVSHFFLDCFYPHQLEQLFDRVLPHLRPGAQWVISEFAIPRNPLAAYFARAIIGLLYRAFGLITGLPVRALPDYAPSLLRRGFVRIHERRYLAGLLCSQLWSLPGQSVSKMI